MGIIFNWEEERKLKERREKMGEENAEREEKTDA